MQNPNDELNEQKQACQTIAEENQRLRDELNLASLQISQLYEELEAKYFPDSRFTETTKEQSSDFVILSSIFDKASAHTIEIKDAYVDSDYKDLHISLNGVVLPDGRSFESLSCKLIVVSGYAGIEFREYASHGDDIVFNLHSNAQDEYGHFLRFFAAVPDFLSVEEKSNNERLDSSERILVFCTINLIAQMLPSQSVLFKVDLPQSDLRYWRKQSIALANQLNDLALEPSIDSIELVEEYLTDTHEHLWFKLNSALFDSFWRKNIEFKLVATELKKNADDHVTFSDNILIEFREPDCGPASLFTWPPNDQDEYGFKYLVALSDISELSDLSMQDILLINYIAFNLEQMLDELTIKHTLKRDVQDWKNACANALLSPSVKSYDNAPLEGFELKYEEHVELGTYQHIVFKELKTNLKIKIKALDINVNTYDAETYIEIRNGTDDLIYNETEFFGEDEYGPRVLIPLEALEKQKTLHSSSALQWIIDIYISLESSIDMADEISVDLKQKWANIINKKASLNQ